MSCGWRTEERSQTNQPKSSRSQRVIATKIPNSPECPVWEPLPENAGCRPAPKGESTPTTLLLSRLALPDSTHTIFPAAMPFTPSQLAAFRDQARLPSFALPLPSAFRPANVALSSPSPRLLGQYHTTGLVIVDGLIPPSLLEPLRAAADAVTELGRRGEWKDVCVPSLASNPFRLNWEKD